MYQTDVLIIGAGAVGVALARELSKYRLRVMICDKNDDVGGDASKSCSSCVATQATMPTGSLEHMLRAVSHPMVYQLCEDLDVPINRCGSLTIAITTQQQAGIAAWMAKAYANGVYDAEVLTRQELLDMEPHLNPELLGGIYVPRDGQINQFLFVVAQAENAAENGVEFLLDCPVLDIEASDKGIQRVVTAMGDVQAKWVINAAGLHCDDIARMVGLCDFSVHPRKGEFFVLGHDTPVKVSHIVRSIPAGGGHGTLVIPTVDGNILVGPNAEDLQDKQDHKTTAAGLGSVKEQARLLVPDLHFEDTITQFVGIRPARDPDGYEILVYDKVPGYVGISGIRSTGLTSSLGIAKYTIMQMHDAGLPLERREGFIGTRRGIVSFANKSDAEKDRLISADPLYGHVVCRCEQITESEIVQAIRRPVGARSIDAVKRRVRAGMGRCQVGFCSPLVIEILARELGVAPEEIRKRGGSSYMLEHE